MSSSPPLAPTAPVRRLGPVLAILAGGLFLVLIALFIGGKWWVESYLHGPKFQGFVTEKSNRTLRANGQFAPFHFSGTEFFCESFLAQGNELGKFSSLELQQMRAEVSLRRFFEGIWQIDEVRVQQMKVQLDGPRVSPEGRELENEVDHGVRAGPPGWLPKRVEIGRATILQAQLGWGTGSAAGGLVNTRLVGLPRDHGAWNISAEGGQFKTAGWPLLELKSAQVLFRDPSVFIQSAELELAANPPNSVGTLRVTGELVPGENLDLQVGLSNLSLSPFLSEDWRVRLHGNLSGQIDARGTLKEGGKPKLKGHVEISDGQLEALPVLEKIALFTQLQQYRRLTLSKGSADFEREGEQLKVKNLILEANGLIRVEGSYTLNQGLIDGQFQVGVGAASLQWLPGSREKVFTQSRAGYVWAPMHLSGPQNNPTEDLSPKLAAALEGVVVEKVQGTVDQTIQTGKDAAKGVLNFLFR